MIRKRFLLPIIVLVTGSIGCASVATTSANTTSDITAADLQRRLFLIAHDSMLGRETGSEGDYKATEYIASEFRRLGLEPAGDNGTYFQTVPFWNAAIDRTSRLTIGDQVLTIERDFLPVSFALAPRVLNGAS